VIQNRGLDYAGTDATLLDLLRRHGAEEIEQRSLVYDVYQNVCGNYPMGALSVPFTMPQFVFGWISGVRFLMRHDPSIDARPRWQDWLPAARQSRVPGPWKLIVTVPVRYMRPSHHPGTEASTQMAMDYPAHSPRGVGRAQAKRRRRTVREDRQIGASKVGVQPNMVATILAR
jgi:predicted metal-dependent hydrolase